VAVWQGASPNGASAQDAWGQVVKTVQAKPWVHCIGIKGDTDPKKAQIEFWFCFEKGITAMKASRASKLEFATFMDGIQKASYHYRASEGVLIQRAYRAAEAELGQFNVVFAEFARGDKKVELAEVDGVRLVGQEYRKLVDDGKNWIVYELTFEEQYGAKERYVAEFRVEPETLLPRHWSRRSPDGKKEIRFSIDYPESGPADVYALGVPATAKPVPRNP
jgi:hypothetical protein